MILNIIVTLSAPLKIKIINDAISGLNHDAQVSHIINLISIRTTNPGIPRVFFKCTPSDNRICASCSFIAASALSGYSVQISKAPKDTRIIKMVADYIKEIEIISFSLLTILLAWIDFQFSLSSITSSDSIIRIALQLAVILS